MDSRAEDDAGFAMPIADVFPAAGGTVVSGRVRSGRVRAGDRVAVVGAAGRLPARVAEVRTGFAARARDGAAAGDNAAVLLRGVALDRVRAARLLAAADGSAGSPDPGPEPPAR